MNGKDKAFMDTNVVIYLYSQTETDKRQAVQRIAEDFDCFISTQVINEFCSVYISKLKVPVDKVRLYVTEMAREFPTVQINQQLILEALDLHAKYFYNYWDCLMIAAAISADCTYLFSEDMQDGHIIKNKLTIKNIFI